MNARPDCATTVRKAMSPDRTNPLIKPSITSRSNSDFDSGQSKRNVATDIYGHPKARLQDEAAEKIEEAVTPIAVDLQQ